MSASYGFAQQPLADSNLLGNSQFCPTSLVIDFEIFRRLIDVRFLIALDFIE
jgi:hypothetical protein